MVYYSDELAASCSAWLHVNVYRPCSKRLASPDPLVARSRWPELCQGVHHMCTAAKEQTQ